MKLGLLVDGIDLVNATKLDAFHTENKVMELLAYICVPSCRLHTVVGKMWYKLNFSVVPVRRRLRANNEMTHF